MNDDTKLNSCIYCNKISEELTDEHIIPLGLGGTTILRSSSCVECNKVTSKFENFILRGHWLGVRRKLKLGTRRKGKPIPPMKVNLIQSNGFKIEGTVPIEECSFLLVYLLYRPEILNIEIPGGTKPYAKNAEVIFLDNHIPNKISCLDGSIRIRQYNEKIEYVLREFTADNFFRFLAKIAHGFAIKEKGINACKKYFLQEIILGNTKDAMKYIGESSHFYQGIRLAKKVDKFHSLEILNTNQYLTVLVQLFNISSFDAQPIYQVIVGEV